MGLANDPLSQESGDQQLVTVQVEFNQTLPTPKAEDANEVRLVQKPLAVKFEPQSSL